jgi:hypothetical protein
VEARGLFVGVRDHEQRAADLARQAGEQPALRRDRDPLQQHRAASAPHQGVARLYQRLVVVGERQQWC